VHGKFNDLYNEIDLDLEEHQAALDKFLEKILATSQKARIDQKILEIKAKIEILRAKKNKFESVENVFFDMIISNG
jgi:SMC interacting uncharacterized protein involved in chromosome segregation